MANIKMSAGKIICILLMHITTMCLAEDFVDTDYYRALINTDGTLTFTDKNTGSTILSNSPQFYYDYGATTSINKPVFNNSFENDSDNDNKPDGWYIDKPYINLSTEQASDGTKSLKFNATGPDISYSHATCPLMSVTPNAKYNIRFDSYTTNFSAGFVRAYVYYYETDNGSGTARESSTFCNISASRGYWIHNSFDWEPPKSARSFKIMIFADSPTIMTVYFDNFIITEISDVYSTDGRVTNHGFVTTSKPVSNSSFEIDDNNDNIPDFWSVDKTYIRLSSEQSSDGVKSLKFDANAPDISHRHAFSPLIPITTNATYTIGLDTYCSFASGFIAVYTYYYNTTNGTGTPCVSSNYAMVPPNLNSWSHISLIWTPPSSALSFKVMIYVDNTASATVYFDNLSVNETTDVYTYTGSIIDHNLVVDGDTTTITTIDNNNPYVTVNSQYRLNAHSPFIDFNVALQYKQDVCVTGERFDFVVPGQNAQVMTRDLKLIPVNNAQVYLSDLYTPKVIRFDNGLSFLGSDTMESMCLRKAGSNSQLSFYSDYEWDHPHISYIYYGNGVIRYINETKRAAGDFYSSSITFAVDTSESLPYLVKTRQPYGYEATLNFTNHPDNETLPRIKAVAYGTEDENDPNYGTKGLAVSGLGWTKGVFVSGEKDPYVSLDHNDYKKIVDRQYQDGVEICPHSITYNTDSRSTVLSGLETLMQYDTRNWIDHSASGGNDNFEDISSQGAIRGSSYYILDLLDRYNYQYAWSYFDVTTDGYALNMLRPYTTSDLRPFFFYNNRVDDNIYDDQKIYLWSTMNTNKVPDLCYTNNNVDNLIMERGVHIGHEYVGYVTCENHTWYNDNNTIKIWPYFDSELQYIAQKRADGLIWSPTMSKLGDYLVPLKDVLITYNNNGTITVSNNSTSDITGVTLLAENTINSVTIDDYSLISFGDSYGNKEIVLPTIAAGSSVLLNISYGTKDVSIPTIVSNDIGKYKINEITGFWDDPNKTLTMTADSRDGNYSFTVTIPSEVNKTFTIRDISLNIVIGDYNSSSNGTITFMAPLSSFIHTFKFVEKTIIHTVLAPTYIDDFNSYTDDNDLETVWQPLNSTYVHLNIDQNYVHSGNYSMLYPYQANSEVKVTTGSLRESIRSDWTVGGVKGLRMYFYGDALNSLIPLYVKLSDDINVGIVAYGDHGEDLNDLKTAGWHQWSINLDNFSSAGVNLANITNMYLGFGDVAGSGNLYFANIQLYEPNTCILSMRSADFARLDFAPAGSPCGDCVIDYKEIQVLANEWLMSPPPDINADLNNDGVIDFIDFAILANVWLQTQL